MENCLRVLFRNLMWGNKNWADLFGKMCSEWEGGQADGRFLDRRALTLFLFVVQVDVIVQRTGAAPRHTVSEVGEVDS
jgi:hypothetical protein